MKTGIVSHTLDRLDQSLSNEYTLSQQKPVISLILLSGWFASNANALISLDINITLCGSFNLFRS